ncbi:hypothetical protein BDB00DRAFT_828437 [Zychaea mexicana]|uniref:uncharacterized protein n=1 Tax=Zychaea mexicana TaxID=64656 RepID=UPI0022FE8C93|nr:uncharacterized protein BDB00DRAFT_828437 [Zychaea mexicana]KAI9492488.1 hypothetical protein BDB00DRAFT_828437 [Zychaea mexicana]
MDVVYSDDCLLHDPPFEVTRGSVKPYVESPARLQSIKKFLDTRPDQFNVVSPRDYSLTPILNVHKQDYIKFLHTIYDDWVAEGLPAEAVTGECFVHRNALGKIDPEIVKETALKTPSARVGLYSYDMSVAYTSKTWQATYTAAQIAMSGAHRLLQVATAASTTTSSSSATYAVCRPPGHHANSCVSGGYCFVNNASVAAKFLQDYTLEEMDAMSKPLEFNPKSSAEPSGPKPKSDKPQKKIMIVDIDYHHGNGTQDIFYNDPSVLYISLHGYPDYPFFTGSTKEVGLGEGEGYNINIPLNPNTTTDEIYLNHLTQVLEGETAQKFNADIVIISMGLDTWHEDPIAGMKGLKDINTYHKMGNLFKTSKSCAGRPVLFIQEGGYTYEMLGQLAGRVLQGYLD